MRYPLSPLKQVADLVESIGLPTRPKYMVGLSMRCVLVFDRWIAVIKYSGAVTLSGKDKAESYPAPLCPKDGLPTVRPSDRRIRAMPHSSQRRGDRRHRHRLSDSAIFRRAGAPPANCHRDVTID